MAGLEVQARAVWAGIIQGVVADVKRFYGDVLRSARHSSGHRPQQFQQR